MEFNTDLLYHWALICKNGVISKYPIRMIDIPTLEAQKGPWGYLHQNRKTFRREAEMRIWVWGPAPTNRILLTDIYRTRLLEIVRGLTKDEVCLIVAFRDANNINSITSVNPNTHPILFLPTFMKRSDAEYKKFRAQHQTQLDGVGGPIV